MKLRHPVARLNGTADRKAPPKEWMVRTVLEQLVCKCGCIGHKRTNTPNVMIIIHINSVVSDWVAENQASDNAERDEPLRKEPLRKESSGKASFTYNQIVINV